MFFPVKYQQEANEHAAKMCKVGNTVDNEEPHKQLYRNHSYNKPPVLNTHHTFARPAPKPEDYQEDNERIVIKEVAQRRTLKNNRCRDNDEHPQEYIHVILRECHAKGKEYAVDCSRCAYSDMETRNKQIQQSRSNAAGKIVNQETTHTPIVLHGSSKHPQTEHIEEHMSKVGMHEHVADWLPKAEVPTVHTPKSEYVVKVANALSCKDIIGKEGQKVDNQQVFYCCGQH